MTEKTLTPFPLNSLVAAEIAQQPELWPTSLTLTLNATIPLPSSPLPVVVTGAGTSAYAASAVAEAWPGARAIPTTDLLLLQKDELGSLIPGLLEGGILISFARSGESPESVAVVERIKNFFPFVEHLAISCNANGKLARMPGIRVISLDPRTNDRSLAMTSSFSNLVLSGLCLRHQAQMSNALAAICDRVSNNLQRMNDIAYQVAASHVDRVVVLASAMHALTREAALKVVELSAGKVMALPETFLGLRHGPLAFLRKDTPVVCYLSSDPQRQRYERDVVESLKSQGLGRIVLVGRNTDSCVHDWFVEANASGLPDALRTPFEIPFMQLLAYQLGIHANVDPDDPSPAGIVTRVVKPFTIHNDWQTLGS